MSLHRKDSRTPAAWDERLELLRSEPSDPHGALRAGYLLRPLPPFFRSSPRSSSSSRFQLLRLPTRKLEEPKKIPKWLWDLIRRGLKKKPEDRHESMAVVLEILEDGLSNRRRSVLAVALAVAVGAPACEPRFQIIFRPPTYLQLNNHKTLEHPLRLLRDFPFA